MFPLLRVHGASVVRIAFHDSPRIILILLSSYVSTFYISFCACTPPNRVRALIWNKFAATMWNEIREFMNLSVYFRSVINSYNYSKSIAPFLFGRKFITPGPISGGRYLLLTEIRPSRDGSIPLKQHISPVRGSSSFETFYARLEKHRPSRRTETLVEDRGLPKRAISRI